MVVGSKIRKEKKIPQQFWNLKGDAWHHVSDKEPTRQADEVKQKN